MAKVLKLIVGLISISFVVACGSSRDEATSSVDTQTEQLIQQAISVLTKGRTSIIVAHRLSTIRQATQILVLDRGKRVEMGKHEELLALGGKYAQMISMQQQKNGE